MRTRYARYCTKPPVRTDIGETAAPHLGPVYSMKGRTIFNHPVMHAILVERHGMKRRGCMFDGSIYGERGATLSGVGSRRTQIDGRALRSGQEGFNLRAVQLRQRRQANPDSVAARGDGALRAQAFDKLESGLRMVQRTIERRTGAQPRNRAFEES